jgi:hypothetical protein
MTPSLDEKYPGRTVHQEGNAIIVTIPVRFYRRNGRQIVKPKPGGESISKVPEQETNMSLAVAIAKAYEWQEELESGQFGSVEELAKAKNIDRSYAGRMLKLTSLSPEIVEMILEGNEPPEVSLRGLRKGIAVVWSQQSEELFDRG